MVTSRRLTARTILGLVLALVQALPAGAGAIRFTAGDLNARSSMYFRGQGNVRATVPEGTEGEVLERFKLPSDNYGIKLRISKLGSENTSLKVDEEIWVYYHQLDPASRRVELFDDDGEPVANADEGNWAVATSSFKTARSTPKPKAKCDECDQNNDSQEATAPLTNAVVTDIKDVVNETNDAPNLDVATEEVVAYIEKDRKKEGVASNPASARQIAKLLIDECAAASPAVPLSLALAIMQQESHFKLTALSPVGAIGLMQVMPDTYFTLTNQPQYFYKKVKALPLKSQARADLVARRNAAFAPLKDMATNIHYGVKVLSSLIQRYGEDRPSMIMAAYNGGPGGAAKYAKGKANRETRRYVPKVKTNLIAANNALPVYLAYEKASRTSLNVAAIE